MNRFVRAVRWVVLGAVFAGVLTACATVYPSLPPAKWRIPPDFRIVGYFPSWSGDPLTVRYPALTHVVYAFGLVDATGAYRPLEAPEKLAAVAARARAAGIKTMVSVGGWNQGDTSALVTVSADPDLTAAFVANTLDLLDDYGLDGVDLDWEFPGASTAASYAALVHALAAALHSRGAELSLAVSAADVNGRFVLEGAWQDADWLNIMAYDDGYGQSASVPHSSYSFARSSLDYWITVRGVPPAKVVLGVPFYGRSLVNRKSRTYRSLLEQFSQARESDSAGGFAYNGPDTVRAKLVNQARVRAGGVMIWQLNQDARGPESLLSLIYETVKEPEE